MYLSFLKHSNECFNTCVERKTYKQYESIKNNTNNSNSPPKLDTSKCFYLLPLSKTILSPPKQNILKTFLNRIPTFHLFLPLFVTYWQRQLKQMVNICTKGWEKIENQGNTKQFGSIENRGNSPHEAATTPVMNNKG